MTTTKSYQPLLSFNLGRNIWGWIMILTWIVQGCSAPWQGEEDNYPVVAIHFRSADGSRFLTPTEAGLVSLHHLEEDTPISIIDQMLESKLDFNSRLDPDYDLILPLAKNHRRSTFILGQQNQSDTLVFTYTTTLGRNDTREFDIEIQNLEIESHTMDTIFFVSSINHPKILLQISAAL